MPEIIDAHTHIFPEAVVDRAVQALHEAYAAQPVRRPVAEQLIAEMDASGVAQAVVAPVSTKPAQVRSINDFVTSLGQPRLIPFGTLHPHGEDVAGEIERLIAAGVRGVKLQPYFQGYDFAHPRTREMFDLIGDRLVVLMHGGQEIVDIEHVIPSPQALADLARDFPKLRMIVAHLGGYHMWDLVEQHLVGADLWFDLSYTFNRAPDEVIVRLCSAHGWERVVWGSDFPWMSQTEALAGLMRLGLDDATLEGVLGGNLKGILDL